MPNAPVAFFAYKRPNHALKTLESLSRCALAEDTALYIFSDGPKTGKDEEGVKEVRRVLKSRRWCKEVHIKEAGENMGLANSLIAGITEVSSLRGKVIVVEDDLVLSTQFLNYMNDALTVYGDEEKVMQVSGFMYRLKGSAPETFFLPFPNCWGWATWERAWSFFIKDTGLLIERVKEKGVDAFTANQRLGSFQMLLDQHEGKLDSWAVRWYASIFLNEGLVLYPKRSLVENIGFDGSGVHCTNETVSFELAHGRIAVKRLKAAVNGQMMKKVLDAKNPAPGGLSRVMGALGSVFRKKNP
ncbi:MAG: glycosyltransferase family 2 protein [Deltaproteobacteria bacterium]